MSSSPFPLSRREVLQKSSMGFGALAMAGLMDKAKAASPLIPDSHFPGKARNVIFLFMEGGVSQVDSFDYKPALEKYHGQDPRKAIGKLEKTQFENAILCNTILPDGTVEYRDCEDDVEVE